MGQHSSHHQNARAVKHRRSTRSLPDVANQGRCMSDEDKARWDAYRKGVYNKLQQQQQSTSVASTPGGGYLPPPALTTTAVVGSASSRCIAKNEQQQNFSSFERSYLAANHQSRPALMSYRKPKSDVGVYGHEGARFGKAIKPKGENRCSKKRDDSWLEVASDFCQPSRRRDDYSSSCNAFRRHQSQPYRQQNGRCTTSSSTTTTTKLDRVPETSYIDEEENAHLVDDDDDYLNDEKEMLNSKSSETKSDFIATCNRKSRQNNDGLKSSRSCYTNLKTEDSFENGSRKRNDCDKVIIQSLQRELNAERNLRINLESRTHKDQENAQALRKQIEKLKNKVEKLNKRLDEKDFRNVSNSSEGLKLQRLQELSAENERLKRENDGLKQNLEKCLENVAAEVARTVVNDKVLKTECIRLQQRVFELEWKQKLNSNGQGPSDIAADRTNGNAERVHLKMSTKTPFNSTEKSSLLHSCPDEDYTEVFDADLNNASPSTLSPYQKMQAEQLNAATNGRKDEQHSPFSMNGGGGGEALCSRPVSLNFDNSGSQPNSSLNGNQEIVVNFMRFSDNSHVTKAVYDVTCSLLANKFAKKFSLDDGYFSTVSSLNSAKQPNASPILFKKWRSLPNFDKKQIIKISSPTPLGSSFPFLARKFSPTINNKTDHLELLRTFLSSRNDLTEFERDSMLQKLEEAAATTQREAMCDLVNKIGENSDKKTSQKTTTVVESAIDNNNDYVECIEDDQQVVNNTAKIVRVGRRSFLNHNASCTSDDSSEYYGEKILIKERWNQLKRKRNFGKLAVVRYKPNHRRPGTIVPNYNEGRQKVSCISRNHAFVRFGRDERQALTCFDFLYERRYDDERDDQGDKDLEREKTIEEEQIFVNRDDEMDLNHTNSIYENLPYHSGINRDDSADPLLEENKSSSTTATSSPRSSPSLSRKCSAKTASDVGAAGGGLRHSSSDSSLFLSQWNLAARYVEENDDSGDDDDDDIDNDDVATSTDQSFTSDSSISVSDLM